MKYQIIYADPPWKQAKGGVKSVRPHSSGGVLEYPTLSIPAIEDHFRHLLEHIDRDCVLFLWAIDKYLHEAEAMAKSLGWKLHVNTNLS